MSTGGDESPILSCDLQGGTLSVYETEVRIDRSGASMFEDKTLPMADIRDVVYDPGFLSGHLQLVEAGVEPAEGGLLSHPVDENTLYFPRTGRKCARRARDAILERI
ncbi:hypothetical protein [Halobaculum gomorrense]|uniref:Uncharacterized protein n=1 Tax=Halobaculum gomorrense TaxID=43928 RepID=A0A1M5PC89_9EURY|nr:hypothetical protein [Halobaculum gomorrense]SHG99335.1 hypothetical protein SAMN05443636_1542 [Halobaculum gomorrense]